MNWIIQVNILIVLTLTWLLFSFQVGFREARYYYCKNEPHPSLKKDEHGLFTIHRAIVFVPHLVAFSLIKSYLLPSCWCVLIIEQVLFLSAFILVFPFFHDGAYYTERNNLNPEVYPLRWRDFNDSTAKFDFTFLQRTIMAIIGLGVLITSLITDLVI